MIATRRGRKQTRSGACELAICVEDGKVCFLRVLGGADGLCGVDSLGLFAQYDVRITTVSNSPCNGADHGWRRRRWWYYARKYML